MTFDGLEGEELLKRIESCRGEAEQVTTTPKISGGKCRQWRDQNRQETQQTKQKHKKKQTRKQNTATHSVPLLPNPIPNPSVWLFSFVMVLF